MLVHDFGIVHHIGRSDLAEGPERRAPGIVHRTAGSAGMNPDLAAFASDLAGRTAAVRGHHTHSDSHH